MKRALILGMAAALLGVQAAPAGVSVNLDFLWSPTASNDTQVYLHISNMAYQPPREQVREVYPRLRAPETEFPVLVYLAAQSHQSLSVVWGYRSRGMTWVQVMGALGVPPQSVFVEMPREPGPPYGKAYGYWRKHPREQVTLTDSDVMYWVNVRSMAAYFHVEPSTVVGWRESGSTWKGIAGNQFRAKKDRSEKMNKAGMAGEHASENDDQGQGGHSKGKGKGHS